MPSPRLIHPVNITIARLNRNNLVMDNDAREPVHGVRSIDPGDVLTIEAQVRIERFDVPEHEPGGAQRASSGYILCLIKDLDAKLGSGVRFIRGDRITAIGKVTGLDLYITNGHPMGHYPDQNGATMFKFLFDDREPVQVR